MNNFHNTHSLWIKSVMQVFIITSCALLIICQYITITILADHHKTNITIIIGIQVDDHCYHHHMYWFVNWQLSHLSPWEHKIIAFIICCWCFSTRQPKALTRHAWDPSPSRKVKKDGYCKCGGCNAIITATTTVVGVALSLWRWSLS